MRHYDLSVSVQSGDVYICQTRDGDTRCVGVNRDQIDALVVALIKSKTEPENTEEKKVGV